MKLSTTVLTVLGAGVAAASQPAWTTGSYSSVTGASTYTDVQPAAALTQSPNDPMYLAPFGSQAIGYGAGATGGVSGGATVTSCASLTKAAAQGGLIKISGLLDGCGVIKVTNGTTIIGVGANSGVYQCRMNSDISLTILLPGLTNGGLISTLR